MRVNLAQENATSFVFNKNYLIMIIIFVVVITSILLNYVLLNKEVSSLQQQFNLADNNLQILQEKRREYINLKKDITKLENQIYKTENNINPLFTLTEQNWNIALIELGKLIPKKVMINSLNIEKNKILIKGFGENSLFVTDFFDNLRASELILNVKLLQLTNNEDVSYVINGELNIEKGEF